MDLYVGTSGYSYREWRGTFYPDKLAPKRMLRYYGERFTAVEINNTFYRMPQSSVLEGWCREVPAGFRFAIKAPQRITHQQQLRNTDDSVSYLLNTVAALKGHLGPLLFQLPPWLRKDLPLLRDFLALLPPTVATVFEFRHPSWFAEDVYSLLGEHHAVLCIADAEGGLDAPFMATGPWGYLRLRRPDYSDAELKSWLQRVRAQEWERVFVFFKHEELASGPRLAQRFLELSGELSAGAGEGEGVSPHPQALVSPACQNR